MKTLLVSQVSALVGMILIGVMAQDSPVAPSNWDPKSLGAVAMLGSCLLITLYRVIPTKDKEHAATVQTLGTQYTDIIKAKDESHDAQVKELIQTFLDQVKSLTAQHTRNLHDLDEASRKTIETIVARYEENMIAAITKMDEQCDRRWEKAEGLCKHPRQAQSPAIDRAMKGHD